MSSGEQFGFFDMFAGIGAFHLACQPHAWQCTGAADKDRYAREVYRANFNIEPDSDVREILSLPQGTDILFAGFPCPTFSLAGKSKLTSLGRRHGLEDGDRGTLIYEVARIVRDSHPRPRVIVLENVKHLLSHDKGQTIETILRLFRELNYEGEPRVLNATDFGIPQNRERVFIPLFLGGTPGGFQLPQSGEEPKKRLADILDSLVPSKYTLGQGTWDTLVRHRSHHEARGHGFGYRFLDLDDPGAVSPTISARYHKDGAEALVEQPGSRPRRLTPGEVARLMGFPEDFKFPVSDTQKYRQLGNSIVVPVAKAVVSAVAAVLRNNHILEGGKK